MDEGNWFKYTVVNTYIKNMYLPLSINATIKNTNFILGQMTMYKPSHNLQGQNDIFNLHKLNIDINSPVCTLQKLYIFYWSLYDLKQANKPLNA